MRERFLGAGDLLTGPAALGTDGGLWLGGAGLGVGVDVLLEEPSGQVAAEFADALLALLEGDELFLVVGVEHQIEGGRGVGEPAPAKGFA